MHRGIVVIMVGMRETEGGRGKETVRAHQRCHIVRVHCQSSPEVGIVIVIIRTRKMEGDGKGASSLSCQCRCHVIMACCQL